MTKQLERVYFRGAVRRVWREMFAKLKMFTPCAISIFTI